MPETQIKIQIYAELLPNIRQVSIIAVLESPCDSSTKADLSASGHQIIVKHRGQSTSLELPGCATPGSQLHVPVLGSKELSWRVPVSGPAGRVETAQSNDIPWSAKCFGGDTELSCKECGSILVQKGAINSWKDLPSENWAEMMDFWHCHKPDVHKEDHSSEHDDPNARKGYGANTKFTATTSTGFIDVTTFLLAQSDCSGIQTGSLDEGPFYIKAVCRACGKYVGRNDDQAQGVRLLKWRISQTPQTLPSPSACSISSVIAAALLAIISSQCVSRFLILPAETKKGVSSTMVLHLWVISANLRYSSTESEGSSSSPNQLGGSRKAHMNGWAATKAMWKRIPSAEAEVLMDGNTIEEVYLPSEAIVELENCLRGSAQQLPPSARRFREWDVGLLERYEE